MNENYKIYKHDYIIENQSEIIKTAVMCHDSLLSDGFGDTTWSYYLYNIFSVSSPSLHYLNIFRKLRDVIRENVKEENIWLQAWLNVHEHNTVLDWHNHSAPFHGYIALEPQDTTTEFEDWSIKNETGNIYFGNGNVRHRVVNDSYYSGKRFTIGFDVIPGSVFEYAYPTKQYGAMPLL
jgi:hypothetical protein|tara:strand:- start:10465 stop:11001 length:537 start_codon:yes stop_codon:yes gene_type:complete